MKKILTVCTVILFLLGARILLSGFTADKYCKAEKNLFQYLQTEEKLTDMVEPTEEERKWLREKPSYKISMYSRAVHRCLIDQSTKIWPGIL